MEIVSSNWNFYLNFKKSLALGQQNIATNEYKLALFPNTYTPDLINQKKWSDISNKELVNINYVAGGVVLTGNNLVNNNTENSTTWVTNSVDFNLGIMTYVKYAVLYNDSNTDKTLVGWCHLDANNVDVFALKFRFYFNNGVYKII